MFQNSAYAHPVGTFTVPNTPPGVDPLDAPLASIQINCEWFPFIRGALTQLLLQSTWDTDEAGLGIVQSQVWRLINQFTCDDMCDCIEFNGSTPAKFIPDGHGGGSFVPIDPRTEGHVPPPWPPDKVPEGQSAQCLSAANIVAIYKHIQDNTVDLLVIEASLLGLLTSFVEFLAFFAPVVGELADLALAMADGAFVAGGTLYADTFQGTHSADMYDALKCILNCHCASDGSFSAADVTAISTEYHAWVDASAFPTADKTLLKLIFDDQIAALGPNGLSTWAKLGGVTSADCSSCDCGWCYEWNFLINDGGFTTGLFGQPDSTWDTNGWHAGHDGSHSAQNFIHITGLDVSTAEVLEVGYKSPVVWDDHGSSFQQQTYESGTYQNYTVQGGAPLGDEVLSTALAHHFDELIIDQQISSYFGDDLDFIITFVRLRGHGTPPTLTGGTTCDV